MKTIVLKKIFRIFVAIITFLALIFFVLFSYGLTSLILSSIVINLLQIKSIEGALLVTLLITGGIILIGKKPIKHTFTKWTKLL